MTRHAHPLLGAFLAAALLPVALLVGLFAPAPYALMAPAIAVGPCVLLGTVATASAGGWRPVRHHPLLLVGAGWLWATAALSASLLDVLPRPLAMAPYALVLASLLFPKTLGFHRMGRWGAWPLALMGPPLDPEDLTLVLLDRLMEQDPSLRRRLFHPGRAVEDDTTLFADQPWRILIDVDAFGCPAYVQWDIRGVHHATDKATTRWLQSLGPRRLLLSPVQRAAGKLSQPIVLPASLGGLPSAHHRTAFAQRLQEAKRRLHAQGFDPRRAPWPSTIPS